ncbi:MAG: ATP-binding protein [Bryobacteraceae bacterium]
MQDFEKLGTFYLGREYDLARKKPLEDLLLYDSQDLVTHAVCVGMTGSGKTGLCLTVLEEAAIDGIPAILIDPKGDLANLLLTFPELRAEDFRPWINEEDARTKGVSPETFAAAEAEKWKRGLAQWGQDGERIRRLRQSAGFAIYTPGSDAGIPVSILKSFGAPEAAILEDRELLRDRINATVTSLLGLAGIDADPIQSREHVLLSTILDQAWRQGQDLDLATLIGRIQTPPVARVGVMDLEAFFPEKQRFALAMALNNLLASPGFEMWLEGEALDPQRFLFTPEGKPRISIFSIAHLSDAERMFFVSLLLNQMLGWVRAQTGTTSLRALLYMDEIFGYFPPVANPPSKRPLLTLLKQARAFGVGIVLATQNPVDLDYKGLSNAGTWWIGRLQTERDKARVLDGLEGAAAEAGSRFDRQQMEQTLASLGSRVFLMNNVHEDKPVVFEVRWAMSYLRGPLSRAQIKTLRQAKPAVTVAPADPKVAAVTAPPAAPAPPSVAASPAPLPAAGRPVLPPAIEQYFVPPRGAAVEIVYRPMLLGAAKVHFIDVKAGIDASTGHVVFAAISDGPVAVDWENAEPAADVAVTDLEKTPLEGAQFGELPAAGSKPKNHEAWRRAFPGWLYRTQKLDLLRSPSLGIVSRPGESERDFRVRLQQAAREERDRINEQLRQRFATRFNTLEDRKRRAGQAVQKEKEQSQQQGMQTAFSIGSSLLGAFLGRKTLSVANVNRAATAARAYGKSKKESQDITRAGENLAAVEQQLAELQSQFDQEVAAREAKADPLSEALEPVIVRPKKTNIEVQVVALAWVP